MSVPFQFAGTRRRHGVPWAKAPACSVKETCASACGFTAMATTTAANNQPTMCVKNCFTIVPLLVRSWAGHLEVFGVVLPFDADEVGRLIGASDAGPLRRPGIGAERPRAHRAARQSARGYGNRARIHLFSSFACAQLDYG